MKFMHNKNTWIKKKEKQKKTRVWDKFVSATTKVIQLLTKWTMSNGRSRIRKVVTSYKKSKYSTRIIISGCVVCMQFK